MEQLEGCPGSQMLDFKADKIGYCCFTPEDQKEG